MSVVTYGVINIQLLAECARMPCHLSEVFCSAQPTQHTQMRTKFRRLDEGRQPQNGPERRMWRDEPGREEHKEMKGKTQGRQLRGLLMSCNRPVGPMRALIGVFRGDLFSYKGLQGKVKEIYLVIITE